jgi:flagellar biosynthetic protein FliQ
MNPDVAVEVIRQALMTTFWLGAPLLLAGFLAGILISLVQIVTSIQDSAFGTVPRLAVFGGAFLLLLPWMVKKMMAYTASLLENFGRYAR